MLHLSVLRSFYPKTGSHFSELARATPKVNRCGAGGWCDFNTAEWLLAYISAGAGRLLQVKLKYSLTVDQAGAGALEARLHGIAPVARSHPAYQHMNDGNRDGIS